MIDFHYELDFQLVKSDNYTDWITNIIGSENYLLNRIDYIFCDDEYLLNINQKYLNHDSYTDIITFDYTEGKNIAGDIFISIERVKENADKFEVDFLDELHRVMSHGVLHLLGYSDKSDEDVVLMRNKEDEKMKLFHVEQ